MAGRSPLYGPALQYALRICPTPALVCLKWVKLRTSRLPVSGRGTGPIYSGLTKIRTRRRSRRQYR
ncbi:hypothetical protein CIJ72_11780 [Neisseria meningitidis]|nr:hypothetical protein CIJ77_11925 [Neisseria meningitidis]RGA69070.1 hypothetical protein CIJ72_11780 [Neisseria meningitidis]RJR70199.1 hypothetical protein CIJ79_11755 [Neisseria meningitidis]RJR86147.1 hypothetical protein CIJ52_11820 [Neisseria meningitidis]